MTVIIVKNVKRKLEEKFLCVTKRKAHLKRFIVLNVPISQHARKLISIFILQKNIAYPSQGMFTKVNFMIKFLLFFIPCD